MADELQFEVEGEGRLRLERRQGVIAGWTGRDPAAIEHHIEELAAIGVPRPSSVPLYYRVSAQAFTQAPAIQVVGDGSSGEVEPLLFDSGEALYLGLGSDHTDRSLETYSVALSKQICAKPVARQAWRFEEVAGHLEQLELRSWIEEAEGAARVLYQEGTIAGIRPFAELLAGTPVAAGGGRMAAGAMMLCGTFPVISGGVRPALAFHMELRDPRLDRSIACSYRVEVLPNVS
ncbi:MAG: DUF2848 domain-containing protein [Tistlia sp.]|uniref:DUF2848 domain-containing protein n=1 Tax=Tistlia sp. TaxID=3057121 RepID=UPI0034A32324